MRVGEGPRRGEGEGEGAGGEGPRRGEGEGEGGNERRRGNRELEEREPVAGGEGANEKRGSR